MFREELQIFANTSNQVYHLKVYSAYGKLVVHLITTKARLAVLRQFDDFTTPWRELMAAKLSATRLALKEGKGKPLVGKF